MQVVDSCEQYVALMQSLFDFDMLKAFLARKDFNLCFDGMHGVSGPYAKSVFVDYLGVPEE